jgi:CO/xanthine dehydrogenase Mo-binding subunit
MPGCLSDDLASVFEPAVIGNAVFAATGIRLRSIPFTPAKVKDALQPSSTIGR